MNRWPSVLEEVEIPSGAADAFRQRKMTIMTPSKELAGRIEDALGYVLDGYGYSFIGGVRGPKQMASLLERASQRTSPKTLCDEMFVLSGEFQNMPLTDFRQLRDELVAALGRD